MLVPGKCLVNVRSEASTLLPRSQTSNHHPELYYYHQDDFKIPTDVYSYFVYIKHVKNAIHSKSVFSTLKLTVHPNISQA